MDIKIKVDLTQVEMFKDKITVGYIFSAPGHWDDMDYDVFTAMFNAGKIKNFKVRSSEPLSHRWLRIASNVFKG